MAREPAAGTPDHARRRLADALAVALPTLAVLAWAGALAASLWFDLGPAERALLSEWLVPRRGFVLLFVLVLPLVVWMLVRPWLVAWPRAARRLREEVDIVGTANAAHRPSEAGPPEMRALARAITELARAHAALRYDVDRRIAESQARLAEQTRRLAALMSELTLGVLVCNRDGRVLLYNERAVQLLGGGADADGAGAPVGLGRTVSAWLDAGALAHAWEQVQHRLAQRRAHPVAHFVTARRAPADGEAAAGLRGTLLRVQMVPTEDGQGAAAGYVLLIDDITRAIDEHGRRDALLRQLTEGTRSALGNLRAAAQTLHQYPGMDAARRARFTTVVHDEAERLAAQLGEALGEPGAAARSAWPLEDVQAGDLAYALQRSVRTGPGIECRFDGSGAARWLEVDSHAIVRLMTHLVGRLVDELGVREAWLEVQEAERFVRLDICWQGTALDPARLNDWEAAALPGTGAGTAVTVRDVLDRHGAELWALVGGAEGPRRLCVQLIAAQRAGEAPAMRRRGRPVAYDFDLFHQPGQNAVLDDTPLAALTYTVFDTETTGLRPSEGDEIIAIGAVRIVNARLLEDEVFDRLTRPRRAVRASAEAVHGISTERLQGEPPLEDVLPRFARFCEDTVLVAHNAAFDMRFLELARERTRVAFEQPVLDTMLLSSVVLPGHGSDEHHLEQIAERLGVAVDARHQALGDAVTTGRVFLRLLPLLAERGIVTLGQARAASQHSPLARETF